MAKIKTAELVGSALDWAVARVIAAKQSEIEHGWGQRFLDHYTSQIAATHAFSTNWKDGGPIIEQERISLRPIVKSGHPLDGQFLAAIDHGNTGTMVQWVKNPTLKLRYHAGQTLLIAAMRCFVASKLGEEIDVPEEIL